MSENSTSSWWPAPAKLNLFLHITGQREDGYHLLQTVFQLIDLTDQLKFTLTQDGAITRASTLAGVAEEDDIVVKAARLLQSYSHSSLGAIITVDKKLPMGGGLAGGSTDAATTLVALNKLWGCGLDIAQLCELGLTLGADVPVFIQGHSAWAEGVGEQLQAIELPENWFLVINPGISVSTTEIFRSTELRRDCPTSTIRDFLATASAQENQAGFTNVFTPLVRKQYPKIDAAMQDLAEFAEPKLTGTGGCIFAAFSSQTDAQDAFARLSSRWQAWLARGLNHSPLLAK